MQLTLLDCELWLNSGLCYYVCMFRLHQMIYVQQWMVVYTHTLYQDVLFPIVMYVVFPIVQCSVVGISVPLDQLVCSFSICQWIWCLSFHCYLSQAVFVLHFLWEPFPFSCSENSLNVLFFLFLSRDKLIFLNSLDLSEVEVYQWKDEENEAKCHDPTTSTFDSSSPEVRSHDSHVIPVDHVWVECEVFILIVW